MIYDVIVVGAGHAGCEAAYATSKLKLKTLLITSNIKNIADMPCNPSVGGSAKGIVVREIDALGGLMGKIADKSHFQIKTLNTKRGFAVRALRAQVDKKIYPKEMLKALRTNKALNIEEGTVANLIIKDKTVEGVVLENGKEIKGKAVILTTGTYLKSQILIGSEKTSSGPHGEKTSSELSTNLKKHGFEILRLKTGTPARIKKESIDFSKMQIEAGDDKLTTFSFDNKHYYKVDEQEDCYLLYTNENTHQVIRDNLSKSSMYGGHTTGVGARYCPSIEDKVVRFSDKKRHQLFLEPESKFYDEWYLQGFSTSMPRETQIKMVRSLSGLENAEISKYAYAIEYDAINPFQLKPTLETKIINNLFCAGQINGTSGYEEAAAQGLMAGINAVLKLKNKGELVLKRNEAYIGVMIDDLVTKGTTEPYRLLTSRAEFRLLLRHDNADLRLREKGYQVGLISEKKYKELLTKKADIEKLKTELKKTKLNMDKKSEFYGKSVFELLKRPEITFEYLKEKYNYEPKYNLDITLQVELEIKYEGYIKKVYKEVEKMLKDEEKLIPVDINYNEVKNLASEAREKLIKIRPTSIGQAIRISGVNPADIAVLSIYLKKEYQK